MARGIARGDIRLLEFAPPDKRRPVLVLSRDEVIPLLRTVMVAPITSAIRGAPSEVIVGVDEGLKQRSAVNLDHVQTVDKARLERFVGSASRGTMTAVCAALAIATGCD
jgi:mRNA interferase MazF